MNPHRNPALHESRTARSNLPVTLPARWRLFADLLFSAPTRVHRYRDLSRRMFEDSVDAADFELICQ